MPTLEMSLKRWCQLGLGGAAEHCERALERANELPDPFKENLRRVIRQGFLEEVRPGVFKPTGKGRDGEQTDRDF